MLAEFFTDYQYFDRERRSQREAGTNDFSLLAALLSVNDEVRLHSRFLYSMLDPRGKHNKGDRFAQHFVAVLGFPGWLNWTRLSVQRETSHIDLYLTDGVRHIIIENKLDALDQPAQIERYVSQIRKKREADGADVLIVYLSKGRRMSPMPGRAAMNEPLDARRLCMHASQSLIEIGPTSRGRGPLERQTYQADMRVLAAE